MKSHNSMDVLVTRYIGIRGTAILSREYRAELLNRYPAWLIDEASAFDDDIELYNDADIIKSIGDESIVYSAEYTEFGVFEALFTAAKELKCGLRINIKDIPVKQETIEVCEFTGVNPYALFSGLSRVIISKDGESTLSLLEKNGISATIVGKTADDNDKLILNEDETGFLPHIRKDELKNKLGRRVYYERTDIIGTRKE